MYGLPLLCEINNPNYTISRRQKHLHFNEYCKKNTSQMVDIQDSFTSKKYKTFIYLRINSDLLYS